MWLTGHERSLAAASKGAAVVAATLVLVGAVLAGPVGARAEETGAQILAAEILVARADLAQIARPDLPAPHRAGFVARIEGALGLIPWLLIVEGDAEGAKDLAAWQRDWAGADRQVERLDRALATLSTRHPLDMTGLDVGVSRAELAEARAIHDAYCAGCHDDMGTGDPEVELAARDLFRMARDEASDQFLARLVNGVKGDESIGFVNPLTEKQIAALWKLYTYH